MWVLILHPAIVSHPPPVSATATEIARARFSDVFHHFVHYVVIPQFESLDDTWLN